MALIGVSEFVYGSGILALDEDPYTHWTTTTKRREVGVTWQGARFSGELLASEEQLGLARSAS